MSANRRYHKSNSNFKRQKKGERGNPHARSPFPFFSLASTRTEPSVSPISSPFLNQHSPHTPHLDSMSLP